MEVLFVVCMAKMNGSDEIQVHARKKLRFYDDIKQIVCAEVKVCRNHFSYSNVTVQVPQSVERRTHTQ